jgi:hypothetical protein
LGNIPSPQEAGFPAAGIWGAIANIWFVVWAISHRGELDYDLDLNAKIIRWFVVVVCLGLAIQVPQLLNPPWFRFTVGLIGIAFLVWPNFAYHLTRVLRWLKLLRRSGSPQQPNHL